MTDSRSEPTARRALRALVMDDDETIRRVAGRLLTALGHDATVAADGKDAVEVYRAAPAGNRRFDV